MKHILTVLLCLLLCGCSRQPQADPSEPAPQDLSKDISAGMYDPDHPIELRYPSQVRGYPLTQRKVHGLRMFGSDVLILSGQGNTTLMLLTGDDLHMTAAWTVGFPLTQEDPSLQIHEGCISYYDPEQRETVLLDQQLQKIRSIAVPRECSGKPILSSDTGTLYYCTPWAVLAWDLESGIRRTVKEIQYSKQELSGLCWRDQILLCTAGDGEHSETLILSAQNGIKHHSLPENARLETEDSDYYVTWCEGFQNLTVFSRNGSGQKLFLPKQPSEAQYYLADNQAVVTLGKTEEGICLDYYNLDTGSLCSSLTLDRLQMPKNIVSCADHAVYILVYDPAADCDTLYRWDVPVEHTADPQCYIYPYSEVPSQEELEQCQQYADRIGQKYGLDVKIGEDACIVQPWDYQLAPENLTPVLQKELSLLEQHLALYPPEVLQQTVSRFDRLTVCLVRSIGSTETKGLQTPTGIQFFEENEAYVVITTGKHSEQAFYHEFYHAMETHILTKSSALDQWEMLNPSDFTYSSGSDPEIYLHGQTRAFVDSYSMTAPKEDRARILENAMMTGNEELFRPEFMQRKLRTLCLGIREAYGLKKAPHDLPWEQYLVTPLIPNI